MFGPKLFLTPHICEIFFFYCHVIFFHSRSRSRVFLGMIASDSHSRIVGMDFFHSLPVPEFWEQIFSFPSHSRIEGMVFFNSLPVPELRELNYPFPFLFPNSQMSFPLTPVMESVSSKSCSSFCLFQIFLSQIVKLPKDVFDDNTFCFKSRLRSHPTSLCLVALAASDLVFCVYNLPLTAYQVTPHLCIINS